MSDSDNSAFSGFGKFVPGFDFLQNLAAQASGSAADKIPTPSGLLITSTSPTLAPEFFLTREGCTKPSTTKP